MKKAVIWDLDGTVLDTLEDLADSVNHVLENHGMEKRTVEEIRAFVGNGIPNLIRRAVKKDTEEDEISACIKEMMSYYKTHCRIKTAPYDGITELMKSLSEAGVKSAIVTNKAHEAAEALCREMFPGCVDTVTGASDGLAFKPAPDGVFRAMKTIGCDDGTKVYYVGDSEVDVMTAHNAGLECIGVTWGFRDRDVLARTGADIIVNTVRELADILLR